MASERAAFTRRVFCFGNPLHGDDGVGSRIAAALRQRPWPEDVEVVDLGVRALELPGLLEGCVAAVLVDAARGDGVAGQVAVRRVEEILRPEDGATISHAADLQFALRAAQAEFGQLPPTRVVTVTVADLKTFTIGLSPAVERAIPVAVARIASLLRAGPGR